MTTASEASHDAGLGGAHRLVALRLARGVLVAFRVRRPRLLDEATDLVDDRDPERLGEGQRDLRLEVVRRRVEDRRPDALHELEGAACARGHHPVVEAVVGEPRGEAVVGDALHLPVARGIGHADVGGKVADRREMRFEAGRELALADRLAAERVADLVVWQRPRDDMKDAAAHRRPAHRAERRPCLTEVGRPARLEHRRARVDHLEVPRGVG